MPDRRVVIVAPTAAEARGEADELGVPSSQQIVATNGHPYTLTGMTVDEPNVVRVREAGWSDELRTLLDEALQREATT